ncbi:MAG: hypothetical protein LDL41_18685 [Coleofasciculus sp. S288]|nr:hypothetical protein [Coleofasciculus sp. S288]
MKMYPTSKLEEASELLELLGVPCPHTFQEKLQTLEASEAVSEATSKGKLKGTLRTYYILMKRVANKIANERLKQDYSALKGYSMKICVTDWRDESEQLFWV